MKAFLSSLVLILVISLGAWAVLDTLPNDASEVFASPNVRL